MTGIRSKMAKYSGFGMECEIRMFIGRAALILLDCRESES
jgi:hypothetical protein